MTQNIHYLRGQKVMLRDAAKQSEENWQKGHIIEKGNCTVYGNKCIQQPNNRHPYSVTGQDFL